MPYPFEFPFTFTASKVSFQSEYFMSTLSLPESFTFLKVAQLD
jgi:hypothetical protein